MQMIGGRWGGGTKKECRWLGRGIHCFRVCEGIGLGKGVKKGRCGGCVFFAYLKYNWCHNKGRGFLMIGW